MKVQGRTFVISGGSSGLGLATALTLLSQGANVSILDVNAPPSDTYPLLAASSRTLYTKTDVSKTPSLQNAVDATVSWIGSITHAPLGGVVACAGVAYGERILARQDVAAAGSSKPRKLKTMSIEAFERIKAINIAYGERILAIQDAAAAGSSKPRKLKTMSIEAFDRIMAINLRGTVDLIRLVLPHLATVEPEGDGERGVLILVSSVAAYEGQVGQIAYSASKAAVAGIVLPMARELGRAAGIRVLGIAPGVFETAMTKLARNAGATRRGGQVAQRARLNEGMVEFPRRMGRPEEFASFVLECLQNGMANGNVFRLDGAVRLPSRL